jgi:hypothetical protein
MDWTEEGNRHQKLEFRAGIRKGRRWRRDAELFIPSLDDSLLIGFPRKHKEYKRKDREEDDSPLCPSPTLANSYERANYGSILGQYSYP